MVDANIKIIEELRFFLETVSKDAEFRKLIANSKDDFTRTRKLPLERLVGIIINMPKRSLSVEIREFFNHLNEGDKSTKSAFSLQRSKLKPLFFKAWNKWLVDNFYQYYGDHVKRWRGFILQAIDGSTAYLLRKSELIEHFGVRNNQHGFTPMGRIMQIHDVLNDITVRGDIYPVKMSEQAIMATWVRHLNPESLTLFDRGFPGYGIMYMMLNEETPRHFLMRCKVDFNEQTKRFARNKKSSEVIELTPSYKSIKMLRDNKYIVTSKTTIKIRMVKFKLSSGETEILITDLYDQQLYSVEDLKHLYSLRWGIETAYGKQKNQLQMEQYSGHRVICVEQDYLATIFIANLQSLIEKQSDDHLKRLNSIRKLNYRINRNVSWAALKHNIVRLFLSPNPTEMLLHLQKEFEDYTEPIRPERKYKRVWKAKRLTGKYQTFTNYKRAI